MFFMVDGLKVNGWVSICSFRIGVFVEANECFFFSHNSERAGGCGHALVMAQFCIHPLGVRAVRGEVCDQDDQHLIWNAALRGHAQQERLGQFLIGIRVVHAVEDVVEDLARGKLSDREA